jgi:hypothetical protein
MSARTLIRTVAALVLVVGSGDGRAGEQPPKRVDDALRLLKDLEPRNNKYVFGGNLVTFGPAPEMKADCSGFLNGLLRHSDGFDAARTRAVFGAARPTAKRYFDAIGERKGFEWIEKVEDIRAGDILAVAYLKNYKGKATGHVMLAAGGARRLKARAPLVEGTTQWEVAVIDSAINGHGPADTRRGQGEGGKNTTGVGKGVLRVYADRDGTMAGYTWSNSSTDTGSFYPQGDRPMRVGRLNPNR